MGFKLPRKLTWKWDSFLTLGIERLAVRKILELFMQHVVSANKGSLLLRYWLASKEASKADKTVTRCKAMAMRDP